MGRKWKNWYQNEVYEKTKGADFRDMHRNEKNKENFLKTTTK